MDKLYNYIFHYNPYTKLWAGIPRGKEMAYFSQGEETYVDLGVITSADVDSIIEFITLTDS